MVDGGVKGLFIDYDCVQRLIIEFHVSNILISQGIYDEYVMWDRRYPILDTRTPVLCPFVRPSRSGYPP